MTGRRAAVLGQPIRHSLSPVLHKAAYEALGLEFDYSAIEVGPGGLAPFVDSLDDSWLGLSLTMPLKVEAVQYANFVEPQAKLVGSVNTLVASGLGEYRQWVGANTDVYGIGAAFQEVGVAKAQRGVIIGGGATACSALAALGAMGVTRPVVAVRNRSKLGPLLRAAHAMSLSPVLASLDARELGLALSNAEVVVSTIPADAGATVAADLTGGVTGALLDVVYSPLDTPLGVAWSQAGGVTIRGTRMLLHQAGEQVRLMTGHAAPLAAMDEALMRAIHER